MPAMSKKLSVHFHKEGKCPMWETREGKKKRKRKENEKKDINMRLLSEARDWRMFIDLTTPIYFPVHIIWSNQHPDAI